MADKIEECSASAPNGCLVADWDRDRVRPRGNFSLRKLEDPTAIVR